MQYDFLLHTPISSPLLRFSAPCSEFVSLTPIFHSLLRFHLPYSDFPLHTPNLPSLLRIHPPYSEFNRWCPVLCVNFIFRGGRGSECQLPQKQLIDSNQSPGHDRPHLPSPPPPNKKRPRRMVATGPPCPTLCQSAAGCSGAAHLNASFSASATVSTPTTVMPSG